METKRFEKKDEGFVCLHCGRKVSPLGYTSRNHCPFCLWSLHVDVFPGDRNEACHGLLEPIAAAPDAKKGYVLCHRCVKCGAVRKNKAANDDSMDRIIFLTSKGMP